MKSFISFSELIYLNVSGFRLSFCFFFNSIAKLASVLKKLLILIIFLKMLFAFLKAKNLTAFSNEMKSNMTDLDILSNKEIDRIYRKPEGGNLPTSDLFRNS